MMNWIGASRGVGHHRTLFFTLGIVVVCAFLAGLFFATPALAQGPEGNDYCLGCHSNQNLSMQLANGETLSVYVDADVLHNSIHGTLNVQCVQCHEQIKAYPHPAVNYTDSRDVTIQMSKTCAGCHPENARKQADSIHQQELDKGNRNAPVCTDCHTAHAVTDPAVPRGRIPETCSQCHSQIADAYTASVHGSAVAKDNNPDVPTCVTCHSVHNIGDPTTAAFRLKSPQLCAGCHTDPAIMSKYGISTDVLNTYVADFHGTTVEVFARSSPDQATNKPVCYDCHGIHDIKSVKDPTSSVTTGENLLKTCRKCHPDATTSSFTGAWMSHYQASPTQYPLVFFVNLFYQIIIPLTVGGLVLFIATDVFHRIRARRAHAAPKSEVKGL